jgi:hypothetical protein
MTMLVSMMRALMVGRQYAPDQRNLRCRHGRLTKGKGNPAVIAALSLNSRLKGPKTLILANPFVHLIHLLRSYTRGVKAYL